MSIFFLNFADPNSSKYEKFYFDCCSTSSVSIYVFFFRSGETKNRSEKVRNVRCCFLQPGEPVRHHS